VDSDELAVFIQQAEVADGHGPILGVFSGGLEADEAGQQEAFLALPYLIVREGLCCGWRGRGSWFERGLFRWFSLALEVEIVDCACCLRSFILFDFSLILQLYHG
jgi:hypothetical protein